MIEMLDGLCCVAICLFGFLCHEVLRAQDVLRPVLSNPMIGIFCLAEEWREVWKDACKSAWRGDVIAEEVFDCPCRLDGGVVVFSDDVRGLLFRIAKRGHCVAYCVHDRSEFFVVVHLFVLV